MTELMLSTYCCDEERAFTIDDLEKAYELIGKLCGPRIYEDTNVIASLDMFALHGEEVVKVEQDIGLDMVWNEFLSPSLSEEEVLVFNPMDIGLDYFSKTVLDIPRCGCDKFIGYIGMIGMTNSSSCVST